MRAFPAALLLLAAACTVASAASAQATARPLQSSTIPEGTAGGPIPGYATEQPARSLHAMVVSIHHLAADAGLATLKRGGNAVDAAVTTAFTLAVVYPYAGNLGGGGFMLVHLSGANGTHPHTAPHNTFIDFREEAPAAATANMYLDAQGKVIPGLSIIGPRSTGVPGSVAGLTLAEKQYGRLGLKKVMQPAIELAEKGFTLGPEEAALLNDPHLRDYAETRAIFGARTWVAGDVFRQPILAKTLRRIASDPDSFYRGSLAQDLAAGLKSEGSLITADDLAHYHAIERTPIIGHYKDLTILSAPPPSSGGVTLIETLNILDAEPTPDLSTLGDRSVAWTHWIVEAFRRAYMDRNDYLGDPAFVRMPLDQMLSPAYALAWRKTIDADQATASASLVRPAGFLPPAPTEGTIPLGVSGHGPGAHEKQETTHFSILDQDGNAVSVTTTLNGAFGSYETAPGLGFLLNDEMDDFTSKVGAPNMFQLIQGPANAIAPGKRPLSSMTPTIVLAKDGTVRMVLGSPGGSRIISTVANVFLSAQAGGLNIQSAVDAPRFHQQYLPDTVDVEPGFNPSIVQGLRATGYNVTQGTHVWSDGECIERDPATGVLTGGQDHRRHFGKAASY
jgi:gamma-glutamyltranspeptidase/glutathione hydrolase